jgi:PAS domain S-box-containing protein
MNEATEKLENLYSETSWFLTFKVKIQQSIKNNLSEKNKNTVAKKLFPSLFLIAVVTMLFMTLYEGMKELIHPNLKSWESHSITIAFSTIIAPIVAYFALKKFELLRREAVQEIENRIKIEKELSSIKDSLENLVNLRTTELQVINQQLKNEIIRRNDVEKTLRENEYKYRLLFKSSPVGIFYYTKELLITDFNDKYLDIFKSTREKRLYFDLKKIEDKQIIETLTAPFIGNDASFEGLYKLRETGNEVFLSLKTTPLRDYKKSIIGGVAIVENIDERKKTERALIEAKEKAERLDVLKSEFLSMISHEIRTPINSILLGVNILNEELGEKYNNDISDVIDSITVGSNRIIRTIELILNMSDILTGGYQAKMTNIDIHKDVLLLLYNEYRYMAAQKKLEFSLEIIKNSSFIHSDRFTLEQIFRNLIDNAIKFTNEGFVKIIVGQNNSGNLAVFIKDSGIGISDEYLPTIFNIFSQEEQGYKRSFDGNGLGLALVKKYCDLLRLDIDVESQKGVGTCFKVEFN